LRIKKCKVYFNNIKSSVSKINLTHKIELIRIVF
jgi:hypothetical protein